MSTAQTQNIVILGAGIMGLSAGYVLLNSGHNITLYDPAGFPAVNASAKAGGMLAPYSELDHMPNSWLECAVLGLKFWRDFAAQNDIGFRQNGSLILAHKQDKYALDRFINYLPAALQKFVETESLEPALNKRFPAGLFLPGEAHLHPKRTLLTLVQQLKNRGAAFVESAAAPDEISGRFDHVIDCRGMGILSGKNDLRGVKGEIISVRNEEFELSRPVRLMHPRYPLYIVPRGDGVFTIGATQIESMDDAHVTLRSAMELLSAAYALHPSFGDAEIIEITSAVRPAYPDNLPRIRTQGNVISANGLFRHGFLLAPVMAECIAGQIAGQHHKFTPLFTGETDEPDHQRAA